MPRRLLILSLCVAGCGGAKPVPEAYAPPPAAAPVRGPDPASSMGMVGGDAVTSPCVTGKAKLEQTKVSARGAEGPPFTDAELDCLERAGIDVSFARAGQAQAMPQAVAAPPTPSRASIPPARQPVPAPTPSPPATSSGSATVIAPDIDAPLRTGARAPDDAAVVIGVEDYVFLPDVPYADRDAQAMEDLFIYTMGIPYDRVRRLSGDASREAVLKAVNQTAEQVGPKGTLWVYFAGHGAASPSTGERLLLGVDTMADADSFNARGVEVEELKVATNDLHRTVLMVDACYAGAARGGQDLLVGKRFAVPDYAEPSSAGWVEWNAAQPNELSGPLEPVRHGAFTFAVAGALRGWADGQISGAADGTVTIEEAQLFVSQTLRNVNVHDQRPAMAATDVAAPLATLPVDKLEPAPDPETLRSLAQ